MIKKFLNILARNSTLFAYIKLCFFRKKWRNKNKHNDTVADNCFNFSKVSVGRYTYGPIKALSFGNKNEKLIIGSFCSIAKETTFLLGGSHSYQTISTYPLAVKWFGEETPSNGPIIVDDDVWIGYRATILSGVHIGQGAIIAAGAVVTKDVPPYSIVGGVPARIIKYRFNSETIKLLMHLDYSCLNKEMISQHNHDLSIDINQLTLSEIQQKLHWFPKK